MPIDEDNPLMPAAVNPAEQDHATDPESPCSSSQPGSNAQLEPVSVAERELWAKDGGPCIIESSDAYDEDRLNRLDDGDLIDAVEFNTELKDSLGIAWLDEELEVPARAAFERFLVMQEDGTATPAGTFVTCLKTFIQKHPRGFARYYTLKDDPWPRPSDVIQAEIDARMPDALYWLRYELSEALQTEGRELPARVPEDGEYCLVRERAERRAHGRSTESPEVKTNSDQVDQTVVMLERLATEPIDKAYMRFVATDPETYRGKAFFDPAKLAEFWKRQTEIAPVPLQFLNAGAKIWRKLALSIPAESTKALMQMDDIDEGTAEAVQAAIFNTFNTAVRRIEMDSVVFALRTFLHTDPLRRHLVSEEPFKEPYGDRTKYGLWDPQAEWWPGDDDEPVDE